MPGLNMGLIREQGFLFRPSSSSAPSPLASPRSTSSKAHHRAHLARLDALFASLQRRAFRGEL